MDVNIKKWLSRAYWADKERKQLSEERAAAYASLFSSSSGDGEKVQKSMLNTTDERYIKYLEYDERLKKQIDKLYDIKNEIHTLINNVDDARLRLVLRMRYLNFMRWEAIAEKMNYEIRQIYRLHKKALQAAEDVSKCH